MKGTPCRQRVANRGADVERIRSLLRLAHFIQVPIRKPGVKNRLKRGADVWKLGDKRSPSDSMRQVGVWLFSNLRKRPHTKTHVHANWNPRELAGSDHNPLPPAPHSGKDITAAQMGWPIQTQNQHSHPHPPAQNSPSSLFLSTSFSPLLFLPFFVCCFLSLFLS